MHTRTPFGIHRLHQIDLNRVRSTPELEYLFVDIFGGTSKYALRGKTKHVHPKTA
jgi:hypothetical protein